MRRATIVVDLGFGDSGKGTVVDYLVRSSETVGTVVRFNGGPQAAHRVVDPDGRDHVFSQFGAGTLVPGVRTLLGCGTLVNPFNLIRENDHLRELGVRDALSRLAIDSRCVLVTPFHVAANRIKERVREQTDGRHGSCGQGVGEARADQLAGVFLDAGEAVSVGAASKLAEIQRRKYLEVIEYVGGRAGRFGKPLWQHVPLEEWRVLADDVLPRSVAEAYRETLSPLVVLGVSYLRDRLEDGDVVFEGAQGVLLDETYGFHPYTTWTDTTAAGAEALLDEAAVEVARETLGVVRAYSTRHGPGPFPTEDADLTAALPDAENGDGDWQGRFRVGWLDVPLLRYALAVCPVDSVAVTCMDRAAAYGGVWRACAVYDGVRQPVPARPSCDPAAHAEALTAALARAEPVLLPVEPTVDGYAWLIPTMTGTPVSLVSEGPTADDKVVLDRSARPTRAYS